MGKKLNMTKNVIKFLIVPMEVMKAIFVNVIPLNSSVANSETNASSLKSCVITPWTVQMDLMKLTVP